MSPPLISDHLDFIDDGNIVSLGQIAHLDCGGHVRRIEIQLNLLPRKQVANEASTLK